jgi:ribosome-associated heat shock protein Hsp15
MRIDKFLWCVRLFKTRSLATEELRLGKVLWNEQPAKASREVKPGDTVAVKKHGYTESWQVLALPRTRVGAPLVTNFILNATPQEELEKKAFLTLAKNMTRQKGLGRPTKRDRRDLDQLFEGD